jgi:Protein of unknown function (DUF3489)
MNRYAQSKRRKRKTTMTNAEANTAANVAPQGAHVATANKKPKKAPTRNKNAPKRARIATGAKAKSAPKKGAKAAKEAKAPRESSKKANVLAMLGRKEGATLAEIMKVTGWQAHSVRGFLSATVGKKMGLAITSAKGENGERSYSVKA